MKNILMTLLFLVPVLIVFAQEKQDSEPAENFDYYPDSNVNMGFGLGLDYGGIGMKLSVLPSRAVAIFAGIGYNFNGAGFNAGTWFRLSPAKKACPTLGVMYGYNAAIIVKGATEYNKTYYGPSIGAGVEIRSRNNSNFVNLEILVPFRSKEFHDDFDALDSNPGIEITAPLPVAISIGYHVVL